MKRWWLLFVAILYPLLAAAKTDEIEVRSTAATLAEVEPGKIVTASFLIANNTESDEEFSDELVLPAGWQKIAPDEAPFLLPAKGRQIRIVAVAVPTTAASGGTEITYVATSRRDYALTDRATFSVVVRPVSKLELALGNKPEWVVAGDEYQIKLRLANHGNGRATIRTTFKSHPAYPVKCDELETAIDAGGSRELTLKVTTDKSLRKKKSHVLNFISTTDGADGQPVLARLTTIVDVIPPVSGDTDPYVRIPAQLRFSAGQESGKSAGVQVELNGAGAIDESGKRKIDFMLRGPDLQKHTLYGLRDAYRVSYSDEKFNLHIGDRTYALSPLTERYGYGRGAEVGYHDGPFGAGLFYMQSRWRTLDFSELGTHVKYNLTPSLGLKTNFLRKWDESLHDSSARNIYSLETRYQPGKFLNLGLEYGLSQPDKGDLKHAFRIDAQGELFNKISYSFEKTHAAPDFHGQFNNTDSTYANVTFPIFDKLRGRFSLNDYTSSLVPERADTTVVTKERSYRGGVTYAFSPSTNASLEFQDVSRKDVLAPVDFDFQEHSLRAGVGHNFKPFSIQTYVDVGTLDNHLLNLRNDFLTRYSVYGYYRPTPRQNYSVFASYGPSSFTGDARDSTSLGISAAWQFKNNVALKAQYSRNSFDALVGQVQNTLQSTLSYKLANHNTVAISGRWTSGNSSRPSESSVFATYSIPLGLPVSKKTSTGMIKGRAYTLKNGAKNALPRVVLLAEDSTTVSDANGYFVFPALKPGTYTLRLETTSIGLDSVTTQQFPMDVEVKRGATAYIDVPVVKAASITGKLSLLARANENPFASDANELHAAGDFAGGLIEITNGVEVYRQETDRHGVVSFDHLRPGKWVFKVYENNLPELHYIEKPETEIDLKAGESVEIATNVLPRQRRFEMIDQGEIR